MGVTLTIEQINNKKPANSLLTAISTSRRKGNGRNRYLNCICACGSEKIVLLGEITNGGTLSCGCLAKANLIKRNTKYKNCTPKLNHCYLDMIRRCYDEICKNYRFYGERGVRVCDEWKNNPQSFYDWALCNGWCEGLHLDKDIKGNGLLYSSETCCFVSWEENFLARRPSGRDAKGKFKSLAA